MEIFHKTFPIRDYDLDATLSSGQAFRWGKYGGDWIGVIDNNWVRLTLQGDHLLASTTSPVEDWNWLRNYLQMDVKLNNILRTFPEDTPMSYSIQYCRGLRLLRQDPWETLASFILSSTKQITQIRQIVSMLCERFGDPLLVPQGHEAASTFPRASRLANLSEKDLRDCKMGFRAPYLLHAAKAVDEARLSLDSLHGIKLDEARSKLKELNGVGPKIADCVLLFAYDFPTAFPVDVWVMKALQELYFPKRKPNRVKLDHFIKNYFGPNSGYAQQYLFHYMRTKADLKTKNKKQFQPANPIL